MKNERKGVGKKWINARLIICSLIFLLVWGLAAVWWNIMPPSWAFGMTFYIIAGFVVVGLILGFIVGRSYNLAASLIFVLFVAVLLSLYPDLSRNTLPALVRHTARDAFFFHPIYPMIGLLGAGCGMVAGNKLLSTIGEPADNNESEK